jgi:hypothetical protein
MADVVCHRRTSGVIPATSAVRSWSASRNVAAVRVLVLPTVALLLTVTVLGGCASGAERPAEPGFRLSATLEQARIDESRGMLSVAMRNDGPATVHVERLQLVTPSLETLPPATVDTTVSPTPRIDLRIPYGEARCAGDTVPEARPAHVIAWVRPAGDAGREGKGGAGGGGDTGDAGGPAAVHEIRLPLPHPNTLLQRLVTLDCGARLVRRAADIGFGPTWRRDGTTVRGTIVVTRRVEGGTITLHDVAGSVILQLTVPGADERPLAVLPPAERRAELPVRISATRCEAHALAESKKTFVFPFWAAVDGLEPQYLVFDVSPEARALLDKLIADTCHTGAAP